MMLLTAIIPTVTADVFPGEPFNGLQVSYSVSGATLDAPADAEGFTLSRSLKGTLDGDELTVSGVAMAMNGWGATLDVRVGIDGEEAKEFHEEKFPDGGLYPDPMSQPFSVTVPVPSDAKAASFTIALTGSYNAGSRGVIVEGHLDRSSSPSGPQSGDKSSKAATSDPRFKAKPSKDLKLYKILQIYSQKIPKGIASSGNKNNLLTWLPYYGSKYDEFKCGGYQGKVLELPDSLKFSDDPEERALLDEWDFGPIETHWIDSGIVLDPWIDQEPKAYDIHSWAGMFSAESIIPLEAGSFHGIRGSSYYEDNPQYPTVGGNYVDPKSKKLSRAENDYVKNLPAEKREIFNRMTPQQRQTWIKMKMAEESKNGKAMGYSPLNLYLVDESGNISGFPGGVPTWQITDVSMRRFPLDDGTYWEVRPYIIIKPGTYTIQDSDSETWSQNQESGGRGISEVMGIYLADSPQSF